MSEFFLELFSEEVPANLQKNARETLLQNFTDFFEKENISFSGKGSSFSTPNRLLMLIEKVNKKEIKETAAQLALALTKKLSTNTMIKTGREKIRRNLVLKSLIKFFTNPKIKNKKIRGPTIII